MEKDTTGKDVSSHTSQLTQQKLYTELGSDDVLLGRGTGPNEFEGNIRFRRLVGEVAMATDPKNLLSNKPVLARKVVDDVANRGGRFVRKLSKGEVLALANVNPINKRKDLYVEVPHAVAIEKAKQSFRHQEKILLDRREDPLSRTTTKGVVGGTLFLKSPPAPGIKDDRLLPPDKLRRRVVGMKPKDHSEKRSHVASSTMTEKSENQRSIIETMPFRSEQSAVSLPSSLYSNILSQTHPLQALATDTTSLLVSSTQQQSSGQLSGPHNPSLALATTFPLFHHGILDPSSLLYTSQPPGPTHRASNMDLLNEVSRLHDLNSLLGSNAARRGPQSSSTSQEARIPDVALQLQEQQPSQASGSLLQLLQEYYAPIPASLSSRVPLTTALAAPLPPPPWSSAALFQNRSLAFGLMGGGAGSSLVVSSMDYSLSSSILQHQLHQQHQQQILLASLGGTLGIAQDSSGGGTVGTSGLQQAGSSSGGGDGVLESVADSLLAAAGLTTITGRKAATTAAPAPPSNVGTNDGSRWPPSSSDHSSTPAETERNDVAADQEQQEASLLEYILRLRRRPP